MVNNNKLILIYIFFKKTFFVINILFSSKYLLVQEYFNLKIINVINIMDWIFFLTDIMDWVLYIWRTNTTSNLDLVRNRRNIFLLVKFIMTKTLSYNNYYSTFFIPRMIFPAPHRKPEWTKLPLQSTCSSHFPAFLFFKTPVTTMFSSPKSPWSPIQTKTSSNKGLIAKKKKNSAFPLG